MTGSPVGGLADRAARARQPDVRLSASVLRTALDDLAAALDERFLRTGAAPGRIFLAYAADHSRSSGPDSPRRAAGNGRS